MSKLSKNQSLGEEIANAVSHGLGALLGIAGLVLMLIKSKDGYDVFGSLVFGISMILLYTMSTLYHSFKKDTLVKRIFKRFDHISIYILIGGTFAPIFIIAVDKPMGWVFLIVQWVVIAVGIIFKAVKINRFQVIHLMLFLAFGLERANTSTNVNERFQSSILFGIGWRCMLFSRGIFSMRPDSLNIVTLFGTYLFY